MSLCLFNYGLQLANIGFLVVFLWSFIGFQKTFQKIIKNDFC